MNNITNFKLSSTFEAASGGGTLAYPNTSYIEELNSLYLASNKPNYIEYTFRLPTEEEFMTYHEQHSQGILKPIEYSPVNTSAISFTTFAVSLGVYADDAPENMFNVKRHVRYMLLDGELYDTSNSNRFIIANFDESMLGTSHTVRYYLNDTFTMGSCFLYFALDQNNSYQYLTEIDLSNVNTTNVTDMSNAFRIMVANMWHITFKGLEKLNVTNVSDMSFMFAKSPLIESEDSVYYEAPYVYIDISSWDLSNKNTYGMLCGLNASQVADYDRLIAIPDITSCSVPK